MRTGRNRGKKSNKKREKLRIKNIKICKNLCKKYTLAHSVKIELLGTYMATNQKKWQNLPKKMPPKVRLLKKSEKILRF